MNILWLSPIPSHPVNTPERAFIQELGKALMRMGHKVRYICCGQCDTASSDAMNEFWTEFCHLPEIISRNWDTPASSFHTITDDLKKAADNPFEVAICNFAFMLEPLGALLPETVKICIPFIDPHGQEELCQWQNKWLRSQHSQHLNTADIIIARNSAEKDACALCVDSALLDIQTLSRNDEESRWEVILKALARLIKNKQKRILYVTNNSLWDVENANCFCMQPIVDFLRKHHRIEVFYAGLLDQAARKKLKETVYNNIVTSADMWLDDDAEVPLSRNDLHPALQPDYNEKNLKAFCRFIASRPRFTVSLSLHLRMLPFIGLIPYPLLKIHYVTDLFSARKYAVQKSITISTESEGALLDKVDGTIFIEKSECIFGSRIAPKTIPLHVPTAIEVNPLPEPERGMHFGMVGSKFFLNTEAIQWFLEEVWPLQTRSDAVLHIYGGVCDLLGEVPGNVVKHGVVDSSREIFRQCNIMLNTHLRGSGFPTKSIQALAHGRPLLSTLIGARGITRTTAYGIYVANNRAEFIEGMLLLSYDRAMRQQFAREGIKFVRENWTYQKCYAPLRSVIEAY